MPEPVMADLAGKTCVVTGASAGIGRAAAEGLARLGARVILAVRNHDKGETARQTIVEATGNQGLEVAVVDLADQRSIRGFARDLTARERRLDVLVNNAGVWLEQKRKSPDGIERTWATNVLGYFLLTDLLLPALKKAGRARVVNVASQMAGDLDLTDVEFERRPYVGQSAYAQSKQADRMLTWALARRLEGTLVTANALHPGFVASELFAKAGGLKGFFASTYAALRAKPPEEGADTVVWLAASPEVEGRTGLFWVDRRERSCRFRGESAEEELWQLCAGMTGVAEASA